MASLPSNTFMFNYNAREYNSSTYTFPKTPGQQFDEDLVLNGNPGSFDGESVNFTSAGPYMGKSYGTTANNPFNRSSSNTTFTFVYKTSGFTEGDRNIFSNRNLNIGNRYNYMVRGNMFHTSQSGFLSLTPATNPQIVFIRIQANGLSERKVVDANGNVLQSVSASSISWGNASDMVGFFTGSGDRATEYFNDRFYWMYCSLEALTDAEIKKVIAYNEGLDVFETDITAITATYETTTSSVTLTAEEDMAWTASTLNDWITLSTTGGTGSSVFTVTLSQNKAYSARNGLVTLTNGEDVIEITVEQAKYPLLIPNENIYRADLEVIKAYRSGSTINKAYRSGELIYYKLNYPEVPDYRTIPLTFNIIDGGIIQWKTNNSGLTRTIEYRKNNGNWTSITSSTDGVSIPVDEGDTLQFRGNNAKYANSSSIYNHFDSTAEFTVEGNIMSLIDSTNFATAVTLTEAAAFCGLFKECSGLTSAENLLLPATTLTSQCYRSLFDRTNITTAPKLPATTLATDCYRSMFFNCTGLTTAPELPATTLVNNCYYFMFSGCTNLNYIKCLATDISAQGCTNYWVNGVASTGTFVTPFSTNWGTGISGIPSGWTRVDA